jgi:hypothetical protein
MNTKKPIGGAQNIPQVLQQSPTRDRLESIKNIYEANILKDPVFYKGKQSQLRQWKDHHTARPSISPLRHTNQIMISLAEEAKDTAEGSDEKAVSKSRNYKAKEKNTLPSLHLNFLPSGRLQKLQQVYSSTLKHGSFADLKPFNQSKKKQAGSSDETFLPLLKGVNDNQPIVKLLAEET